MQNNLKMKKFFIKKLGFTLAEILITLGIIGVVAALTLPTLIANNQKIQYLVGLKKFYAAFNLGMKNYMVLTGCSDLTCTGFFDGNRSAAAWQTRADVEIPKIFKAARIYGYNNSELLNFAPKFMNNNPASDYFYHGYTIQTADGALILFDDQDNDNCTMYSAAAGSPNLKNACSDIYVDINGKKPPNIWGRDVYWFILSNNGMLYPFSGTDHHDVGGNRWTGYAPYCGVSGSSSLPTEGDGCAARIMEEGWEMNY